MVSTFTIHGYSSLQYIGTRSHGSGVGQFTYTRQPWISTVHCPYLSMDTLSILTLDIMDTRAYIQYSSDSGFISRFQIATVAFRIGKQLQMIEYITHPSEIQYFKPNTFLTLPIA